MSVVEEIEDLLQSFQPKPDRVEELKRLSKFFETMKAEGVAYTREYDLPQLDTIGRTLYETSGQLQIQPGVTQVALQDGRQFEGWRHSGSR